MLYPAKRPFVIGDAFTAEISLCKEVSPLSARQKAVAAPASLPAPTFNPPTISVPGARIRVYDGGGIEIGDGSGAVIVLSRALTGADTLPLVQQLGECTSSTGYRVSVRNASSKG